jgi:hypothetical protein
MDKGTTLTLKLAEKHVKPILPIDLSNPASPEEIKNWIQKNNIKVLNIAGPRESFFHGIHQLAYDFLQQLFPVFRNMKYQERLTVANTVIKTLKEELLCALWDTNPMEYGTGRILLPWLEEDSEYQIKKLSLHKKDEDYYLQKIHRIFGEYSEIIPLLKKKKL